MRVRFYLCTSKTNPIGHIIVPGMIFFVSAYLSGKYTDRGIYFVQRTKNSF